MDKTDELKLLGSGAIEGERKNIINAAINEITPNLYGDLMELFIVGARPDMSEEKLCAAHENTWSVMINVIADTMAVFCHATIEPHEFKRAAQILSLTIEKALKETTPNEARRLHAGVIHNIKMETLAKSPTEGSA